MKKINVDDFAPELDELWDNGTLGRDEHYAAEGRTTVAEIDEILGVETVSLRFNKELLQDLKDIAELNGLGYQPLIKQILQRFVDGEKRMIANAKIQEDLQRLKNESLKNNKTKIRQTA